MARNHSALVTGVVALLRLDRIDAWSQNTGGAYYKGKGGNRQFVRFGRPGMSDVLGLLPRSGTFLAVECKVGRDTLSEAQVEFRDMIRAAGGVYIECRDLNVLDDLLSAWKRGRGFPEEYGGPRGILTVYPDNMTEKNT